MSAVSWLIATTLVVATWCLLLAACGYVHLAVWTAAVVISLFYGAVVLGCWWAAVRWLLGLARRDRG